MTIEEIDMLSYIKNLADEDMGVILCRPEDKSPVTTVIQAVLWAKRVYYKLPDIGLMMLEQEYKDCMIKHFGSEAPDILNCQKNGYISAAWNLYNETAGKIRNKIREHLQFRSAFPRQKNELTPEIYITDMALRETYRILYDELEKFKDHMYFYKCNNGFPEPIKLSCLGINRWQT